MTTAAERRHLGRLAALGCIACLREGLGETPAEIHHPRSLAGMSQKASHFDALPLCPPHHRTGGHGIAIHAGQRTWEAKFGTEVELLADVRRRLGIQEAA